MAPSGRARARTFAAFSVAALLLSGSAMSAFASDHGGGGGSRSDQHSSTQSQSRDSGRSGATQTTSQMPVIRVDRNADHPSDSRGGPPAGNGQRDRDQGLGREAEHVVQAPAAVEADDARGPRVDRDEATSQAEAEVHPDRRADDGLGAQAEAEVEAEAEAQMQAVAADDNVVQDQPMVETQTTQVEHAAEAGDD